MEGKHFQIVCQIHNLFFNVKKKYDVPLHLIGQGEMLFNGKWHKPNIAFYSKEQLLIARKGENIIPKFLIEIIPTNALVNDIHQKMEDYYNSEVEVIWHILPEVKQVHIYNGRKMEVKKDDEICSANSIIEGFEIKANELFG